MHRIGDGFHLRFSESAIIDGNCLDVGSIKLRPQSAVVIATNYNRTIYRTIIDWDGSLKADPAPESAIARNPEDAMINIRRDLRDAAVVIPDLINRLNNPYHEGVWVAQGAKQQCSIGGIRELNNDRLALVVLRDKAGGQVVIVTIELPAIDSIPVRSDAQPQVISITR